MGFKEFNQIMIKNNYQYTAGIQFYLAWIMDLAHKIKKIRLDTHNPAQKQLINATQKDQQAVISNAFKLAKLERDMDIKIFETYVPALKVDDILAVVAAQKQIAPYLEHIGITVDFLI